MATNKDFKVKNGLFVQEGVLKGYSTALAVGGALAANQFVDAGPGANIGQVRYTDTATASPNLLIGRARGTTLGSFTTVQSGDRLATIIVTGADGTAFTQAASLLFEVDGAVATGQVPGRLMFSTTSSTGVMSERMRITSGGDVGIGQSPVAYGSGYVNLALGTATGGGIFDSYYAGTRAISMFSTVAEGRLDVFGASRPLNVYVNGSQRMTIDAAGNVGIGAGPSFKFDVQNTANSATVARVYNGTTGSSGSTVVVCQTDAATTNLFANSSGNVAGGVAALSGIQVTTNTPFGIWTNNAERIRITAAGEVLIGASSQTGTAKLYVAGARSFVSGEFLGGLHVTDSTTGGTAGVGGTIAFGADSQGAGIKQYGAIAGTKENSTVTDLAGYLAFYSRPAGGSLTERMRIDSAGNLGIGSTPVAGYGKTLLLSQGVGTAHPIILHQAVNTDDERFYLLNNATPTAGGFTGTFTYNKTGAHATTYRQLGGRHTWASAPTSTAGAAVSFTETMELDANGNLGVNTTAAIAGVKLNVAGGVSASGLNAVGTGGFFNSSNKFGVDNNAGQTRFYSSGANSTTRGSYDFRITDSVGSLDTSAMVIDSAGNVGIGITTPGYKLDVLSTSQNNPVIRIVKANSGAGNEHGGALIIANQGPANFQRAGGTYGGRIVFQYSQPTSQAMQDGASIYSAADGAQNGTATPAFLAFCTSDSTAGGSNQERMRITAGGAVGIGTGAPASKFDIGGTTLGETITFSQTSGNSGARQMMGINYRTAAYTGGSLIAAYSETTFDDAVGLRFYTGSGLPERMRIDSVGSVLIGLTATPVSNNASNGFAVVGQTAGTAVLIGHINGTTTGAYYSTFSYNAGIIGSITQNGTTAVSYNTTSDARLKKNIVPAQSAVEKVKALQVRSFDWKADDSRVEHGFIAQELQTVEPLAVTEGEIWQIDPSKLVATLTKALQEALARIEALEAKLL
jgi:hypothetical protein